MSIEYLLEMLHPFQYLYFLVNGLDLLKRKSYPPAHVQQVKISHHLFIGRSGFNQSSDLAKLGFCRLTLVKPGNESLRINTFTYDL